MDYLTFRSGALSSLALTINRKHDRFPPNHWTEDDIERWVKEQYLRHYNEDGTPKQPK